jgi:hypothetical protein
MSPTKSSKLSALALCMALSFTMGCANNQVANSEQLTQKARSAAGKATQTPAEALAAAADQITQAQAEKLEGFAPLHMASAVGALKNAQDLQRKQAPATEVLAAAFKVGHLLDAARKNKTTVELRLGKSLEHKLVLEQLGAPELLPLDFNRVVAGQLELIRDIERGLLEPALKGELVLLQQMAEVEIKTLKIIHLKPVDDLMRKARSEAVDDFAQQTYKHAQKTLESAHRFIETRYRDRDGVTRAGIEALHAATHASQTGREAKQWVSMNKDEAERKVLYVQSLLSRINQGVGVANLNTLTLEEQIDAMTQRIQRGEMRGSDTVEVFAPGAAQGSGLTITPIQGAE